MAEIIVEAERREAGGKNVNRRLRKSGRIPAVVYGRGRDPIPVIVDPITVSDILHSDSGQNTIFKVSLDGRHADVMVKDYQLDPVKGSLMHADLFEIAMDRLLELSVNVEIVGEAEGVKLGGGLMDIVTRSIDVECLPADIPDSIKVDVTALKINDNIRVKNLQVDPKIKILTEPEVVIVTISPPIKEEVPVEAAPETAEPEVIKKGKVAEEAPPEEQK
jgi:large subunit ribosomal protein L25